MALKTGPTRPPTDGARLELPYPAGRPGGEPSRWRTTYAPALLATPLLIWTLLIHLVGSSAWPQINLVARGAVIALLVLICLVSSKLFPLRRFSRRAALAAGLMAAALLLAARLIFFLAPRPGAGAGGFPVGIDLTPGADFLIALSLVLVVVRSSGHFRIRGSVGAAAVATACLAGLASAVGTGAWDRVGLLRATPWDMAFALTLAATALYCCVIFTVGRDGSGWGVGYNRKDFILALLLLLVSVLGRLAALEGIRHAALLAELYDLLGLAWLFRYAFLAGCHRLMASEKRFRTLFEQNGQIILLLDAVTGKIVDANSAAVSFYGYSRQQLQGLHLWDIAATPRHELEPRIRKMAAGQLSHAEDQRRLADGCIREVDAYMTALDIEERTVIYEVVQDITERKKAQAGLALFRQAAQCALNGVVITEAGSPDTPIIYANPAFESLTGYELAEICGKDPRFLQGSDREQEGRAAIHSALAEKRAVTAVLRNYRKDGTPYWCELAIAPVFTPQGTISHWVAAQNDITARRQAEQELQHLVFVDPLTGIPNRRLLLDRLGQHLELARRTGRHGALLFIDLDQFKSINDTQGHDAGDELLRVLSTRLGSVLRKTDTVARLGGDEFVVLLPGLAADANAAAGGLQAVLQRIRKAISEPVRIGSSELSITASIGITFFPRDPASPSDLITRADITMYRAKDGGGDTTCYFGA